MLTTDDEVRNRIEIVLDQSTGYLSSCEGTCSLYLGFLPSRYVSYEWLLQRPLTSMGQYTACQKTSHRTGLKWASTKTIPHTGRRFEYLNYRIFCGFPYPQRKKHSGIQCLEVDACHKTKQNQWQSLSCLWSLPFSGLRQMAISSCIGHCGSHVPGTSPTFKK